MTQSASDDRHAVLGYSVLALTAGGGAAAGAWSALGLASILLVPFAASAAVLAAGTVVAVRRASAEARERSVDAMVESLRAKLDESGARQGEASINRPRGQDASVRKARG